MKILGIILALAVFLRIWNLGDNPPGLTWDEAALGYNAYSILQTGKDEYGNLLPLNLKSFGDYKPAIYAYVAIPFLAVFGLNEWAVRLPSVVFGVLGVVGVYLLVWELFKKKNLSLLSAFLLAISPWHLQFSRPAFEANMALTLNLFGVYFLIKGFKNSRLLIFSALIFGLSLFTYQGSRIFVPLIILAVLFCFKDYFKKTKDSVIAVGLLGVFFLMLFLSTFLTGQTNRLNTLNFFAYTRSEESINLISKEDGLLVNSPEFQVLHGEWFSYIRGLAERYLVYFSPKTLFIDGDYSERHTVPDLGILYYFSALLIPLGLIQLIKGWDRRSSFILLWLAISPIPAILSRDLISTLRALNMVLPLVIVEAFGLYYLVTFLKTKLARFYILGLMVIVLIFITNFLIYLDRYYIHAPTEYSKFWLYGYKQAFIDLNDTNQYNKVVITEKYGQPYIYYLFYSKYPPAGFQKHAVLDQPTVDTGTVRKIDNIEFRNIYWPGDRGEKNSLFIGTTFELPDQDVKPFPEFKIIKEVNFKNGEPALRIVETAK